MYSIKNVEDLKNAYNTLMLLKKKNGENSGNSRAVNLMKQEIRFFNRTESAKMSKRVIRDYGKSGYITLEELPHTCEGTPDIRAVEVWFECCRVKTCNHTESRRKVSCEPFTMWYKIVKRNGKYYAYHRIGLTE